MAEALTPSQIARNWIVGPRDAATTFTAMQEISESAELLEELLDDCLTVIDLVTDDDAVDFVLAEAERIRGEADWNPARDEFRGAFVGGRRA